ncbi:hypothetical protein X797_008690 [Metarhizium robertsii]|uniref:Uncharacterized protein n=1 Tax=Metarhizium robertsii TaxID=568076 RepID=A0A014P6W0_9HYPO|nr:hypothetical protein X797_008690 [Metarhizium robertsii]
MFSSILTANSNSQQKYKALSSTHDNFDRNTHYKRSPLFLRTTFPIAIILCSIAHLILICHAITLLKAFSSQLPNTAQDPTHQVSNCSCGATIHEARALDCTFDVLSVSWLPPSCRDDELTVEFAAGGPGPHGAWDYWAHENGTWSLTLDEVAALVEKPKSIVYTSWEFHVLHCSFYWRKQWRVSRGVGALFMEARYALESYVKHFQNVFMKDSLRKTDISQSVVRLGGEFF